MDRAVDDPLYRMHHGRNTFTLEVNWAYSTSAQQTTKKKITPVTQIQDGCRFSRRKLERNRRKRQRAKEARALLRTTAAKSPIVITPDVTPPAKTQPTTSTPMDQETPAPSKHTA